MVSRHGKNRPLLPTLAYKQIASVKDPPNLSGIDGLNRWAIQKIIEQGGDRDRDR